MKQIKILLTLLILLPFISASGLQIISHENLDIEKNYETDKQIQLIVYNGLEKDFHNIQFEEEWIESTPFNLSYQENKTITITIKKNEDFDGEITLRGEYEQNIGASNQTTEVKINYETGITPCNIEIIEGDSINWINEVPGDITLVEKETGNDFLTILDGENKTKKFNIPQEFIYYAEMIVPFTNDCIINVQDDNGLVHSSEYDFKLPTKIKINYEPTELELTALETNYTISYNGEKEDIIKIKNIGNKIGKNLELKADWFEFDKNNFDLDVGESINVGYTISPDVYSTNETNKTHKITLEITGNFETIKKDFNIFIPYKDLDYLFSGDEADENFINEMIKFYCEERPELEACMRLQNPNINGSTTNVQFSSDAIKKIIDDILKSKNNEKIYQTNDLEFKEFINKTLNNQSKIDEKQSEELNKVREEMSNLSKSITSIGIILLSLSAGYVLFSFWQNKGRFSNIKRQLGYQKGELEYR
jgi:hypothetical protein